jgi:hypothetical protein
VVLYYEFTAGGVTATAQFYVNGVAESMTNTTIGAGIYDGNTVDWFIGNLFGATQYLKGQLGELMFFYGIPSVTERKIITKYLGNKWGIAVTI